MKRLRCLLPAAAMLLGACAVGPDYRAPQVEPGAWAEEAGGFSSDSPPAEWWRLLGDERLDAYVAGALAGNREIRIARARLAEARALRGVTASVLWPELTGKAGYTWFEQSLNSPGAASQLIGAGLAERDGEFWTAGLDASWELDLFGGNRRRVESAEAAVAAAEAGAVGSALAVIAETVAAYVELAGADRRLAITAENLDAQRRTVELTRAKADIGLARELDVLRAEAEFRATAARLPGLRAAARASVNRLSILTGEPPGAAATAGVSLPAVPPALPRGLRAEVLRRRPDVIVAERRLAAATAAIGVAVADFFPRLVLGAGAGLESQDLGELGNGDSRNQAIVPFLRWPVFQGGRLRAALAAAEAREREAAARYEQAVLVALEDAESALAAYEGARETLTELQRASAASAAAADIAARLYQKGLGDFLSVLDAERRRAETDDERVQAEIRVLLTLVRVYKALGGGWDGIEPTPFAAVP